MIKPGLQVLLEERLNLLAGKRVGLVSHPASTLPDLTGAAAALVDSGVRLGALFTPEDGAPSALDDGGAVTGVVDKRFGVPAYSLEGELMDMPAAALKEVDALVFDMQGTGTRFDPSLYILYTVLRAASEADLPVILLDRPNPINGVSIEGPLTPENLPGQGDAGMTGPGVASSGTSFSGAAAGPHASTITLPIRHGMTLGELALFMNKEYELDASLTIVSMRGWARSMWYDETNLPWIAPSPSQPHLSTLTVYPGMCFFQGTNLSEGIGTCQPFEIAGAPWIDSHALAERLNKLVLPGVRFRPLMFTPCVGKFEGQVCEGVQIHVNDRQSYRAVMTGLHLLASVQEVSAGDFAFTGTALISAPPPLDMMAALPAVREWLTAGRQVDELISTWAPLREQFTAAREPYLLY